MRTARSVVCSLRLMSSAAHAVAPCLAVAGLLGIAATLVACDDDNDPKTWVKKLDDPAQRANAIKRLTQFYEDGMTKASNDASAPEIKSLLDTIVDPLTKTYTAGGLDDKTRTDLMKFLAETHDPRTQPALAKALKDFEMGKTDDEARVACESISAMHKNGVKLDQTVVDELWNVFAKFNLSKTTSQRLFQALHDAILEVKDPSYADKAIDKLKVAVPPNPSVDVQKDQLMWWQLTSVQLLSDLKDTKAVKPLIVALLTPTKTASLGASIQFALLKMAKSAEPELIKALNGTDPAYNIPGWEDKTNIGVIARVLAILGRPAGRDAILAYLPTADTGTARTELAQALTQMPADPRCEPAYLDTYKKVPWGDTDNLLNGLNPRIALAQTSANFYDPKLTDWLLKEMKGAPDYSGRAVQLEAEVKLMTPDREDDVMIALNNLKKEMPADGFAQVQNMWNATDSALKKCKTDASCYLSILDEPIPTTPPTAYYKQVKATWMAVIYGGGNAAGTRSALLSKVDKVQNAGARIAVVEAIDELSPTGDVASADALDKIVAADTKSGEKPLISVDNTVAQVAWRLRVRGQ
ncbi:MAG TPA: hypothetical protein VIY73_18300 [Polyangiaceae bacterium]